MFRHQNRAFINRYVKKKTRRIQEISIVLKLVLNSILLNLFPLPTLIICTCDPPCNPKIKKMWTLPVPPDGVILWPEAPGKNQLHFWRFELLEDINPYPAVILHPVK